MEELVWRKEGEERCVKSYRPVEASETKTTEKKALDEDLRNFTALAAGTGGQGVCPQLNKREEASAKMNERYLVGQSMHNPFMPNSNYASDIEAQMTFLTPQKGSF
jgi:hypothetical protein